MPRPKRCRRICSEPLNSVFYPSVDNDLEGISLTLDEYEVIRLVDLEGYNHLECAKQMDISRSTVQEIYESARRKIASFIVYGRKLYIRGGNYQACGCSKKKEGRIMKIAVTYENEMVFQHFGHTAEFKIYDVVDGKIVSNEVVDTNGSGHGALAGFLMQRGVDTLICGGIGGGAINALSNAGIKVYGGVSGNVDTAVNDFISGKLEYNPDVHCDHHHEGEEHKCGHHCGK